jgi:hypothetical protein
LNIRKIPRHILYYIILTLVFASCIQGKDSVEKLWFYTHSNGNVSAHDTMLTPASFISLKKDGTYTLDFEEFQFGTWTRDKQIIHLRHSKNQVSDITISYLSGNEMQLAINGFNEANFESQPAKFKSPSENPFSIENNRWRIPAEKKESAIEIKKRIVNHLRFWELYFSWALSNDLNSIDVRSTPTLLKIYGNGFQLKPVNELPPKWKSCFYDEEDCIKSNAIMKKIFEETDIAWAHTDNKYKMFISAFQQLQQKIKF